MKENVWAAILADETPRAVFDVIDHTRVTRIR
jgi:hypothetical protein